MEHGIITSQKNSQILLKTFVWFYSIFGSCDLELNIEHVNGLGCTDLIQGKLSSLDIVVLRD